jgi:hypothetical protein
MGGCSKKPQHCSISCSGGLLQVDAVAGDMLRSKMLHVKPNRWTKKLNSDSVRCCADAISCAAMTLFKMKCIDHGFGKTEYGQRVTWLVRFQRA